MRLYFWHPWCPKYALDLSKEDMEKSHLRLLIHFHLTVLHSLGFQQVWSNDVLRWCSIYVQCDSFNCEWGAISHFAKCVRSCPDLCLDSCENHFHLFRETYSSCPGHVWDWLLCRSGFQRKIAVYAMLLLFLKWEEVGGRYRHSSSKYRAQKTGQFTKVPFPVWKEASVYPLQILHCVNQK